jgi:hypothetical protein
MSWLLQGQSAVCCIITSQLESDNNLICYIKHQVFQRVIKMFSIEQCVHLQYLRNIGVVEKNVAGSFVKNPTPTVSYTKARDKVVGKILMTASLLEIKYMKIFFNSSTPTPHS